MALTKCGIIADFRGAQPEGMKFFPIFHVSPRLRFPLYQVTGKGRHSQSASLMCAPEPYGGVWPHAIESNNGHRFDNPVIMFPQLFQVGHLTVYSYGVLMGLGTLLAIVWPVRLARLEEIPPTKVEGLGLVIVLCAVIGSKLLTAFDYPGFYSSNSNPALDQVLNRGGVFYGGFLLAILGSAIYMRLAGLPGWQVADCVAPGLALAQGLGRIGCFLAGCCWGRETDLPVGVIFTSDLAHQITGVPLHMKLHPTQLYEAALTLLAIPFLLWLRKHKSFDGQVVLIYVLYYAAVRFFLEFFRGDPRGYYFDDFLSTSQLISLVIIPIAALLLVRLHRQSATGRRRDRQTPHILRSKVRAGSI